jgi:hypothetical protein
MVLVREDEAECVVVQSAQLTLHLGERMREGEEMRRMRTSISRLLTGDVDTAEDE